MSDGTWVLTPSGAAAIGVKHIPDQDLVRQVMDDPEAAALEIEQLQDQVRRLKRKERARQSGAVRARNYRARKAGKA